VGIYHCYKSKETSLIPTFGKHSLIMLSYRNEPKLEITLYKYLIYSTTQLQLHFYTRGHAWHHAVFCMLNAKVSYGKYYLHVTGRGISTRQDVSFPRDESYNLHETWSTKWHPRKNHNNYYCGVPCKCSYLQLKPVSEYPVYIPF